MGKIAVVARWSDGGRNGPVERFVSIFDHVLHIPAEQRPFVSPLALTRVTLPLVARPGLRFAVAALGAVAMALACLTLALVLAAGQGDIVSRTALVCVFVGAALIPAGVAATALRDALSARRILAREVLTIDSVGILDTRLDGPIGWDEVGAATIVGAPNGIAAVRLTLRTEREPRYNPFRIGGLSVEWQRRRRDRLVALTLLDRRPYEVAHTILTLAGRHGATIEAEAPPWSCHED